MSGLKEHIFCDIDEVFPRGYCGPLPSPEVQALLGDGVALFHKRKRKAERVQIEDFLLE